MENFTITIKRTGDTWILTVIQSLIEWRQFYGRKYRERWVWFSNMENTGMAAITSAAYSTSISMMALADDQTGTAGHGDRVEGKSQYYQRRQYGCRRHAAMTNTCSKPLSQRRRISGDGRRGWRSNKRKFNASVGTIEKADWVATVIKIQAGHCQRSGRNRV